MTDCRSIRPLRRGRRLLAVALAVPLAAGVVACGEDETANTTSTTSPSEAGGGNGSEQGSGEEDDVLNEIEDRGKPELGATDPVTELQVTDDVVGTGAEVQPGDTITAHYVGVSASTGEEFDSSWDRGEPATFPLNGVIQGWSEGLVGMKVGGRRTLVIPADMAYGQTPPPGAGIAPGETLVFTVDLVGID
jgi:peptidylprolyl isomerase